MSYFVLIYSEVVPDFFTRRGAYREEHLRLARESQARGELLFAGGLGDPPDGSLLIFRAASAQTVEDFARQDPYVANGLIKRREIRPWTVAVGNL